MWCLVCACYAVVWKLLRLISGDADLESCVRKALVVLARDESFNAKGLLKALKAAIVFSHRSAHLCNLAVNIRRGYVT